MSDRPLRSCDECGQIDNHPRHVFDTMNSGITYPVNTDAIEAVYANKELDARDAVRIVRDLEDTTVIQRHMDCCAAAGCPDGTCDKLLEQYDNAHGLKLAAAITGEKVQ